jgi:hypothetical protein
MFAKAEGATSLRPDLVWALSLSIEPVEIETGSGRRPCEAGVAAVWTGTKGEVVVVIRQADPPAVARYAFTEPILSTDDLDLAVENALGFLQEMGFFPDPPGFRDLPSELQHDRLERWNKMRKVRKGSKRGPKASEAEPPTRDVVLDHVAEAPPQADAPAPAEAREASPAAERGRSVLGRIAVVRREGAPASLDALGRLLSFF